MVEEWVTKFRIDMLLNNITQRELAEKTDYTEQYISMLMQGKKNLSKKAETKLRDALEEIKAKRSEDDKNAGT